LRRRAGDAGRGFAVVAEAVRAALAANDWGVDADADTTAAAGF
jgi:hypothetical protein